LQNLSIIIQTINIDIPDWLSGLTGIDSIGFNIPEWKAPQVQLLTSGGYVEATMPKKYSLFAAGENGIPEILGTVGGRSAVAGGEEITGIREAVYSASQEEIILLRQQNQLLQAILEKELTISSEETFKATQKEAREYKRRTHRPAFG